MKLLNLLKKTSKGVSLGDLQSIVLTFVVIGIVGGVGVLISTTMEQDTADRSTNQTGIIGDPSSEALNNTTRGLTNLIARLPLIGTIAGFIVLLGFVVGLLARRQQGI